MRLSLHLTGPCPGLQLQRSQDYYNRIMPTAMMEQIAAFITTLSENDEMDGKLCILWSVDSFFELCYMVGSGGGWSSFSM